MEARLFHFAAIEKPLQIDERRRLPFHHRGEIAGAQIAELVVRDREHSRVEVLQRASLNRSNTERL